jgi:hypothetical protein
VSRRAASQAERRLEASLARLDRRGFLRATGLAAAAGLLPTGCGGAPADLAPPPDLDLAVLSPRTYATFRAASGAILGPRGREAARAAGVDLAARADARLADTPAFAELVQRALLALEFGVPPLVPKWRTFTGLAPDARGGVLARLATARWDLSRALFQGVRSFTWLAWYAAPESHAAIHYPPPYGGTRAGRAGAGPSIADAMTYDVERPSPRPGARP